LFITRTFYDIVKKAVACFRQARNEVSRGSSACPRPPESRAGTRSVQGLAAGTALVK